VAVRDEDRHAASAESSEFLEQAWRLRPGIDDDGFRCGVNGPDHVAIRADRAELKPVDCKAHEAFESNGGLSRALKITAVQSWNLREIETPGGTRSPVVLRSDESARAVLIVLDPGQALGDHQMKERALVSVVDGSVRVESGGEAVEGGEGSFFSFDADERRSISTDKGARILLVFAPWPGEGHYRGDTKVDG
jgi:quercetin dioxygenase-like cupin family protein